MSDVKPRFEFRTFAQSFGKSESKLRGGKPCEFIRESSEIYIISAGNSENNTKVRDDKMDIKVFVKEEKGLEQWNPRMKGTFPMSSDDLKKDVFPAFGVEMPELQRENYTLDQYLAEVINPHPKLVAVNIFKKRFGYMIDGIITEFAEILVNGAKIQTMSVESDDIEGVLRVKSQLALDEYENVNYLRAIKRVIGMEPLPKIQL